MLTADLVRPRMKTRGVSLSIDYLKPTPAALRTAADLIVLFQAQVGQTYDGWDTALEAYMGDRVDYTDVRGLAKVLEDVAVFAPIELPVLPADVRRFLFERGPVFDQADLFHTLERGDAIRAATEHFGITPEQIELALFADRPGEYLLVDAGQPWTPDELIARYNLELARAALYWCSQMTIDIHDGYKDFWRYLKFFKLMYEAYPLAGGGYHLLLDGPISPFVRSTTRYGRQFAAFLPALLLGERWQMDAEVRFNGKTLSYRLDPSTPLRSHFKRSGAFDSRLEADFAAEFEAKFGGKRGKWQLAREDEVILLGDVVMIPDFSVTHADDGRRALIEIVGFWHPEYLQRKVEKVRAANRRDLILLVYEGVNLTDARLSSVPGEILYFANKPVLKDVIAAIERAAQAPAGHMG